MAENKTTKNDFSVQDFLNAVESESRRQDSFQVLKIMQEITGLEAKMWGPSIVGFGDYHYKYESGREGDMFRVGFSPRKQNLTIYIANGFSRYQELLSKLGKHKTSKACLYINKLSQIDVVVLKSLISESLDYMNKKYPIEA